VNAPFSRNDAASGTVTLPVDPSNVAAVSPSATNAPGVPNATPPAYTPDRPCPDASPATPLPAASPNRHHATGPSAPTSAA